jgi:hypothetical protein
VLGNTFRVFSTAPRKEKPQIKIRAYPLLSAADLFAPRGATIKKIGEYFNVSPSVLLNDSNDIEYIPEEDEKRIARQMAFERSEMRTLFDLAVNAQASQIYEAITLLQKYKEESEGK